MNVAGRIKTLHRKFLKLKRIKNCFENVIMAKGVKILQDILFSLAMVQNLILVNSI
jgi:hypothetical protein